MTTRNSGLHFPAFVVSEPHGVIVSVCLQCFHLALLLDFKNHLCWSLSSSVWCCAGSSLSPTLSQLSTSELDTHFSSLKTFLKHVFARFENCFSLKTTPTPSTLWSGPARPGLTQAARCSHSVPRSRTLGFPREETAARAPKGRCRRVNL